MPCRCMCSIERISEGVFIEVKRCPKKRCLALSKAERAADFNESLRPFQFAILFLIFPCDFHYRVS